MDKQECKDSLLSRKGDVIAKECIGLLESCVFTLKRHFRDREELEERDKDCIPLIRVAQGNLDYFKDKSNTKIDLLKSTLSKMYEDEKINNDNLNAAKTELSNIENQKKTSENELSSSKVELERINAEINKKEQEIDELNKKHSNLLQEIKNFKDQKTGKESEVSKLLADENNAQNSLNQAGNDYHFVQTSKTNNNPCWDSNSPHFRQNCIEERKNKMHEKQSVKDDITKQKNQAVNELNYINSQIQIKINEINDVKSSISTHQQVLNDQVAKQTLKNNELNSVQSSITKNTQDIDSQKQQIEQLQATSQENIISGKEQELHQSKLYLSDLVMLSDDISSSEFTQVLGQTMNNVEL